MQRDSKLGYGFLLVGAGVPYLIDKGLGLIPAICVSVACVIGGGTFLFAGARHREGEAGPRRKIWELLVIAGALSTLVVLGSVGILRVMPKKDAEKSIEHPTTKIQPPSEEAKKEPLIAKKPPSKKMAKTYLQLSNIVPNQQFAIIAAGKRLGMNVHTRNMGPLPAHEVFPYTRIQIAKLAMESQIRKTFLEEAMRGYQTELKNGINKQLGIGEEVWDTLVVGPFEENEATEFLQGSLRLYAFSLVKWKDPDGNLGTWTQCQWLQAPRGDSGRCRSVFRGMPITRSGMMAIMIPG